MAQGHAVNIHKFDNRQYESKEVFDIATALEYIESAQLKQREIIPIARSKQSQLNCLMADKW